ncbi:hypothetical protein [Metabacillus sp. 22489]|uniref:hypothetical protein n=1 Tax=Metabacillus sp. 22489 TaxID=3453928 RepID=UPI003F83F44D
MRLPKTAYLFKTERIQVGISDFDLPVYEYIKIPTYPFDMEREPYSSDRAKMDLAINVIDVQFLMYTEVNDKLKLNTEFTYDNRLYKIIHPPLVYDNHLEILIKDIGEFVE